MHYIILHFTYLLLDFMVQGKINRGRHTDYPAGRHSIQTKSSHALGLNALTVQASTMELGKLFQIHTYRHNHFNCPFFRHYPGEPVPEEIFFWTLWCKGR